MNHFIEIQKDSSDNIYIMLHSGSRNLGLQVANHYNELAKNLNKQWHSGIPSNWKLAFLPFDSEYGQRYFREMNFCLNFAYANRKLMMTKICDIFNYEMSWKKIDINEMINIHHNYAALEHHYGHNVLIHRKGATRARKGEIGLIPGSQATKSYIVRGKGNPESFESCSHGSGRKMSRTQAKKELNLEEEIRKMNELGIIHGMRNEKDLEEAGSAYKDIEDVMKQQEDLVEILVELTPIANIKG